MPTLLRDGQIAHTERDATVRVEVALAPQRRITNRLRLTPLAHTHVRVRRTVHKPKLRYALSRGEVQEDRLHRSPLDDATVNVSSLSYSSTSMWVVSLEGDR